MVSANPPKVFISYSHDSAEHTRRVRAWLIDSALMGLRHGYLNLLMQASTDAVAVLGLTIVLGYTGQINLAQAACFGLGAYSVALGAVSFGLPSWPALFANASVAGFCARSHLVTSLRTLSRDRPIGLKRQQVVFREKVYSRL
jgi:ABC-type branched-subunit amino acid transport system permease subunit